MSPNNNLIEARFSSVSHLKARQPGREKGSAAEGSTRCLPELSWVVGEHPPDCHMAYVKRYHGLAGLFFVVSSGVHRPIIPQCAFHRGVCGNFFAVFPGAGREMARTNN